MIFNFLREELPIALLSCYFRERGEVAGQKTAQLSTGGGPGLGWPGGGGGDGGVSEPRVCSGLPASAP